jgi:SAM-dependent methyltransferase
MNRAEYAKMFALEDRYWWFRAKRAFLASALTGVRQRLPDHPRILDVGCGTGAVLAFLETWGTPFGIDREAEALAFCRERGHTCLAQGQAERLPFADGVFDLVVMADMLEHLPADVPAVAEAARVLAPGGILLCTVPAHPFLYGEHDRALHHYRRYARTTLHALLARAGLRVLRITPTYASILLPAVLARSLGKLRARLRPFVAAQSDAPPAPGPLNAALLGLHRVEAWWLRRHDLPFGLSLLAIAESAPHLS